MATKLQKTVLPAPTYWHKFQRIDGTFFEIKTTRQNIDQLGTKEHIDPKNQNGKYVGSGGKIEIPLGFYAEDPANNQAVLNLSGVVLAIALDKIEAGGTLTPEGETQAQKLSSFS